MLLHLLLYILLFLSLVAGLVILVVNLPGLWVMVLATAVYSVLYRPILTHPTIGVILVLLAMAAAAEIVDFFAAGAGAKRAGGTSRGLWGAIIGSIAGAIVGSIMLPLILTLVGVCVGTFIGAFIGELSGGMAFGQATRISTYATLGRLAGTVGKMIIGSIMLVITLYYAFPSAKTIAATPPPATIIRPAGTQPTTGPVATAAAPRTAGQCSTFLPWYSGGGLRWGRVARGAARAIDGTSAEMPLTLSLSPDYRGEGTRSGICESHAIGRQSAFEPPPLPSPGVPGEGKRDGVGWCNPRWTCVPAVCSSLPQQDGGRVHPPYVALREGPLFLLRRYSGEG
jgi:uncharacterized protein YqgC (DUF456 family)